MYGIEFGDLTDKTSFCKLDSEVNDELQPFIQALRREGDISGSKILCSPLVSVPIKEISVRTFTLQYYISVSGKVVKIVCFKQHPNKDSEELKEMLNKNLPNEGEDGVVIPQADNPIALIKALELIYNGVLTPETLAVKLGHKCKTTRDNARHGNYKLQALQALKLITRNQKSRSSKPELTSNGLRIANCRDRNTQARFLAESMLGYQPILELFQNIKDGRFDFKLVDECTRLFSKEGYSTNTLQRRAKCLESWSIWLIRELNLQTDQQLHLFHHHIEREFHRIPRL